MLILLFVSNFMLAQINYEKGYFIDNTNQKSECFIKMEDWKNSPSYINYKMELSDSEVKTATLTQIKEFEVGDFHKYQKCKIKIDESSFDYSKLSRKAEPEYIEKEVLLKVLVGGNATLYEYTETGIKRFFYSISSGYPTDLIYKKYVPYTINGAENYETVLENKFFIRQLYKDLNCNNQDIKYFNKIHYTTKELSDAFIVFNNCNTTTTSYVAKEYTNTALQSKFNIKVKGGINSTRIDESIFENYDVEKNYEDKLTYSLGTELEYIFPFNKNKWSIFLETTYNSKYTSDKIISSTYSSIKNTYTSTIDYSTFIITTGLKHKMFFTDNFCLFVSPNFNVSFPSGNWMSEKAFANSSYKLTSAKKVGFGFGAEYKNKITFEIRFNKLSYGIVGSKTIQFLLAYKIFDNKK